MGAPRRLTPDDLRALAFAKDELVRGYTPHPDRTRAIRLIGDWIEQSTAAPLVFRMGPKGWMIGTGEGERLVLPSEAIGEGLRVLYDAVGAPPLEPCRIPRVDLGAARMRVTRARQFIRDRCAALADLLEDVVVTADESGKPVAVYRPRPGAPKVRL